VAILTKGLPAQITNRDRKFQEFLLKFEWAFYIYIYNYIHRYVNIYMYLINKHVCT